MNATELNFTDLELELKINAMKKDGKQLHSFLMLYGSTKNISLKSDDFKKSMYDFLVNKGF